MSKEQKSAHNATQEEDNHGITWQEYIEKYWIYLLAGLFLFTAILYFLKLAIEEGWITATTRTILGILVGVGTLSIGCWKYRLNKHPISESICGLGFAIVMGSLVYAGANSEVNWPPLILIITFFIITSFVFLFAQIHNARRLAILAVVGGFAAPLGIKIPEGLHFILFVYALVLNISALYLFISKSWKELSVLAYFCSFILYLVYYTYYDPFDNWSGPYTYLTVYFLLFFMALQIDSVRRNEFQGLNLFLGLANIVHLMFWTLFIFSTLSVSYFLPMTISGLLFLFTSMFVYDRSNKDFLSSSVYYLVGMVFLAIAGDDLAQGFRDGGMHNVVNTSIWLILTILLFAISYRIKFITGTIIGSVALFFILIYWFTVAWDVDWVRWFGLEYIPFINPGALVWIAIASSGFLFSRLLTKYFSTSEDQSEKYLAVLPLLLALASHVVVGGLLTIQIQNAWQVYSVDFLDVEVFLSISWMIYAMLIFVWGAYSNNNAFRWMGSFVIILVSIKVFVYDLSESSTISVIFFLIGLAILTFTIAIIDMRWRKSRS